jgi:tetratricopeptide (TPR) repeat protein
LPPEVPVHDGIVALRLGALLVLASLGVPAFAQDERPSPKDAPAPEVPEPGSEPANPLDGRDLTKKKQKTTGTQLGRPMDKDAAKTVDSRDAYLAEVLADAAREARGPYLDTAMSACLDAATAAIPADANADARAAVAEGRKLLAAGRWADAQAQAARATALDWKLLAARLVAARALEAQGRADDALEGPLDTAVASAPDDPVALHARAIVAWRMGRLDDARKDLVHAREAHPGDGALALSLGALELDRGDAKGAHPLLMDAADAFPQSAFALRTLARALHLCRDWAGAAAAFERVVRLVEGPPLPPGQIAVVGRGTAPTEHLALAVLCADRLDRRAAARAHAQAFAQEGGIDLSLRVWLESL